MVSKSYMDIVKHERYSNGFNALRCFSAWFRSNGLIADACELLPEVAPENANLYHVEQEEHWAMASSTMALAVELRPAGPMDVRCMPRVLQAFHRHAGVSKTEATAKEYVRVVKKSSRMIVLPSRTWLAKAT